MPNGDTKKKSNENNGLGRPDPWAIGPFGAAQRSIANLAAGLIYEAAVQEMIRQEAEIRRMLESIEDGDSEAVSVLRPLLEKELAEIEQRWTQAMSMYATEEE